MSNKIIDCVFYHDNKTSLQKRVEKYSEIVDKFVIFYKKEIDISYLTGSTKPIELVLVEEELYIDELITYIKKSDYDFEDIISKKQLDNIEDTNELVHILADIDGKTEDFKESIIETKKIVIFVGSEGGFSENEINQIEYYKNTLKIKLSNNRLRAETAAISILSNTLAKLID